MTRPLRQFFGSLAQERDANVTLISALALVPSLFGLGFSIDYSRAEMLQSRINAVADAAALTATDMLYIQTTSPTPHDAAYQVFTSQVTEFKDFSYNPNSSNLQITVTDQGGLNLGRTAKVDWAGYSLNMFSGILGMNSLVIGGTSTAYATQAPYMNFFLAMDKSPSMMLPSTSTGITSVKGATSDSCAFACHQQQPGTKYVKDGSGKGVFIDQNFWQSSGTGSGVYYLVDSSSNLYDSSGNKLGTNVSVSNGTSLSYKSGTQNLSITGYWADGYWLTHNYTKIYPNGSSIDLRVSDETAAAQALIPYAQSQATINNVAYQLQFFSFDWTHPSATSPVTQYNSMTDVNSLTASSVPDLDGTQDWWYSNGNPTSTYSNNDQATEFKNMLTSLNAVMPTPGTGVSKASPQEVLMIITDGVVDENTGSGRRNRELSSTDIAACTTIKNRGIKIAIIYTYYDPAVLAGDSWSQSNVAPYLPNVLSALQSCASNGNNGTPLVYTVQSDQSISTALQTLFQLTIANSHLIG